MDTSLTDVNPIAADEEQILSEIATMLRSVLGDYDLADVEIGMGTRFTDDLDLESIDLVTLAGELRAHYGERVNFPEFLAGMELPEIIELNVGQLVRYVAGRLRASGETGVAAAPATERSS